jgi:hypothetical protein
MDDNDDDIGLSHENALILLHELGWEIGYRSYRCYPKTHDDCREFWWHPRFPGVGLCFTHTTKMLGTGCALALKESSNLSSFERLMYRVFRTIELLARLS